MMKISPVAPAHDMRWTAGETWLDESIGVAVEAGSTAQAVQAHPPMQLSFLEDIPVLQKPVASVQHKPATTKPRRKTPSRFSAALGQMPLEFLDQPIAGYTAQMLPKHLREIQDLGVVIDPASHDAEESSSVISSNDQTWSDDAVAQLHEGLLLYSLSALGARSNGAEKLEILEWIYEPDVYTWSERRDATGKTYYRAIPAKSIPFTFQRCCAHCGLDQDRLREGLTKVLRQAGYTQFDA